MTINETDILINHQNGFMLSMIYKSRIVTPSYNLMVNKFNICMIV